MALTEQRLASPKQGGILQGTALDLTWDILASMIWACGVATTGRRLTKYWFRLFWGHLGDEPLGMVYGPADSSFLLWYLFMLFYHTTLFYY